MSSDTTHKRMLIVAASLVAIVAPTAITLYLFRNQAGGAFQTIARPSLLMLGTAILIATVVFLAAQWFIKRGYPKARVNLIAGLLAMTLFVATQAVVRPLMTLSLLGGVLWVVPLMVGFSIMGSGARHRQGDQRFCAKCEYPFIDDPGVIRCPECGAGWLGPLGTVKGTLHVNRTRVAIGSVIALSAFALQMGATAFQSTFMRVLPTSLLIHQAANAKGFDDSYWSVLTARTLTPDQETRLALAVIDARVGGHALSRHDETWLDARVRAGTLPAELVARYFAEMVGQPRIVLVGAASPGSPTTLQLEAVLRTNLRNTQDARVIVEGWWVDGVFTPTVDTGAALSTYALEPGQTMSGSINAVRLTIPAGQPGPVRVKCVGWIAIGPFPSVGWRASWSVPPGQPGATPTLPGATSWMQRFEAEAAIEVK